MKFTLRSCLFKNPVLALILFYVIFLSAANSSAQVINVEKMRKGDKNGLKGMVGAGFSYIDNGKKIATLKNNLNIQYNTGPSTFILLNELSLMRVDKDNLVNAGFQHLRYNYTVKDSSFFTFEGFFQHQYNMIKLLERRLLGGLGPRFRIIGGEKAQLHIGTLAMYEFEQLSDSLKTRRNISRLDSYLSIGWQIKENLSLTSITYYQPAFIDPQNFRLSSENGFQLKITNSLSLNIGFQINYDSRPPENVQKLFYDWQNELIYNF